MMIRTAMLASLVEQEAVEGISVSPNQSSRFPVDNRLTSQDVVHVGVSEAVTNSLVWKNNSFTVLEAVSKLLRS